MTPTPITLLKQASDCGLKLGAKPPHTLTVQPGERCPQEFAATLKAHKLGLLPLLQLPFVMVYSERMGETLFFCEHEDTKAALVEAGACEWSIYTKAELRTLCAQNRIAPISSNELRKLHEIRKTFEGRITK
jgi:hypothetical protein